MNYETKLVMTSTNRLFRSTAAVVLVAIAMELIAPAALLAITSGPAQPDFTGFEPLGTTGMVNEFTGSFTYNLPLLEVPGPSGSSYPVTLAYHSGAALEEDASWVGFGWSLNPGAINRGARGVPDDYKAAEIQTINRQEPNETYSAGVVANLQIASFDMLSFQVANRYNTFSGYSITSGLSVNVFNAVSLQLESTNGVLRYSANVNWANCFAAILRTDIADRAIGSIARMNGCENQVIAAAARSAQFVAKSRELTAVVSSYVTSMSQPVSTPTSTMEFTGGSISVKFAATVGYVPGPILTGANGGIHGNYTWQKPIESMVENANGYLYHGDTTHGHDQDWMSEREGIYTNRDRYLSPGYFTPDEFSVSGQGIGGTMRLVRSTPGYARVRHRSSRIINSALAAELGFGPDKIAAGASVTLGANFTDVYSPSYGALSSLRHRRYSADGNNRAFLRFLNDPADNVRFTSSDEAAKTTWGHFYSPDGVLSRLNGKSSEDSLYRPRSGACVSYRLNRELADDMRSGPSAPSLFSHAPYRNDSITGHLNRSEALIADGIGEVSVTNANGIRYVYGLPVYNRRERQLSYSRSDVANMTKTGLGMAYGARILDPQDGQERAKNVSGTVKNQPYASMILLTAIQTSDYVDRTLDGPSSDDFGGYTQFSYARAAGSYEKGNYSRNAQKWYKWRTPFRGYTWEEGRRTNPNDDQAAVFMGEREMYYMSEIDTKTHTAIFITNKTRRKVVVGGKTVEFNGSGRDRNDAFESFNTGNMDLDEQVVGSELWRRNYICGIDADSAQRHRNKICGGRIHDNEYLSDSYIESNLKENKSQCLERIVLLAKDADGAYTHVVKTVNLEYTYETMQADPNWYRIDYRWDEALGRNVPILNELEWDTVYSITGQLNSRHYHTTRGVLTPHLSNRIAVGQYGKLTLKRVWTDYGDVKNATISPYEFVYRYRDQSKEPYAEELLTEPRLDSVIKFADTYVIKPGEMTDTTLRNTKNSVIQNPMYDPACVDAWGAYRRDGTTARANRRHHLNQSLRAGKATDYDPAAWQLKRILLPSGGEIEVQYEQNTYSYIQDRPVEAFVPLSSYSEGKDEVVVNLDCSGLSVSTEDVAAALQSHLRSDRLYFKFLFPVHACSFNPAQSEYPGTNSEYVSGFVNASVRAINGDKIEVAFSGSPLPRKLLEELVMNQGLVPRRCPTPGSSFADDLGFRGGSLKSAITKIAEAGAMISDLASVFYDFTLSSGCTPYLKHSFVRIPCVSKKGGGVRVRRILMYDAGIEQGQAGMYGKEYIYERQESTPAGIRTLSSGVATNEPAALREESALYRFLVGRTERSFTERLAAGEDLEQLAGPLCPTALPGATIGYSRVVTRSIASGVTSPGFTVSDFYTARDYPVIERATQLDNFRMSVPALPNPIIQMSSHELYAGQGFVVVTNQMHGKTRALRQCAGSYTSDPGSWRVVSSEEHVYYEPGEKIPVLSRKADGAPTVSLREMGTTEEFMISSRIVLNSAVSVTGNFDLGTVLPFLPLFHVAIGGSMVSFQYYAMNTSTKVVSYACHEKRVVYRRDGMVRVQENGAFDEGTGQPVITIGYDEYDGAQSGVGQIHAGAILQMTYPAWYAYPQMGSAMTNENTRHGIESVTMSNMIVGSGVGHFVPGDLVALVGSMEGSPTIQPSFVRVTGSSGTSVSYYVLSGTPSTNHKVATIVRSGRTNQLVAAAGSTVMHGAGQMLGQNPFAPNSARRVLSSSATTWSDNIGMDTSEYYAVYGARFSERFPNDYERALRGKWRPHESFVFRSGTESVVKNAPARSAGRVDATAYSPFPFASVGTRDTSKWIRTSRVLVYTPDGDIAAEQDAIGIPTTARFSHQGSLPSIIAKNADHASALFESFEDRSDASSEFSHTGLRSLALSTMADSVGVLNVTERVRKDGLIIRAWVRALQSTDSCHVTIGSGTVIPQQTVVVNVAGWRLIEWNVPAMTGALATTGIKTVRVRSVGSSVHVDDLRIQPLSSSATCYVYDPGTLRLIAQFDDQHFAALFKYTPEGRLSRKDRETELGVFPLQEQHANSMSVKYSRRDAQGLPDYRPLMQRTPANGDDTDVDAGPQYSIPELTPGAQGVSAKGELFDLRYGGANRRLRLFGDSIDMKRIDSMFNRDTISRRHEKPVPYGGNRK